MWLVPSCSSMPSLVNAFLHRITPALFISRSSRSSPMKEMLCKVKQISVIMFSTGHPIVNHNVSIFVHVIIIKHNRDGRVGWRKGDQILLIIVFFFFPYSSPPIMLTDSYYLFLHFFLVYFEQSRRAFNFQPLFIIFPRDRLFPYYSVLVMFRYISFILSVCSFLSCILLTESEVRIQPLYTIFMIVCCLIILTLIISKGFRIYSIISFLCIFLTESEGVQFPATLFPFSCWWARRC